MLVKTGESALGVVRSGENFNDETIDEMIPEEIMLEIFSMLSIRDNAQTALVSKKWERLAGDQQVWRRHSLEDCKRNEEKEITFNETVNSDIHLDWSHFQEFLTHENPPKNKEEFKNRLQDITVLKKFYFESLKVLETENPDEFNGVVMWGMFGGCLTRVLMEKISMDEKKCHALTNKYDALTITQKKLIASYLLPSILKELAENKKGDC